MAPFQTKSSVNPHAQSGIRRLWGTGADEYAAPMWSVMFVKARDDGFIAMIRLSTMYRMMVASSMHRVARLPRTCALVRLCMWVSVVTGLIIPNLSPHLYHTPTSHRTPHTRVLLS